MNRRTIHLLAVYGSLLVGLASIWAVAESKGESQTSHAKLQALDGRGLPEADVHLIRTLNQRGVPVVIGACHAGLHGLYEASDNVLLVCSQAPSAELSDTLRHEAIHAAQDCKAGQDNPKLEVLDTNRVPAVDDPLAAQIRQVYPVHAWKLEGEAYALAQELTSVQVAQLVARHC